MKYLLNLSKVILIFSNSSKSLSRIWGKIIISLKITNKINLIRKKLFIKNSNLFITHTAIPAKIIPRIIILRIV